MADQQHLLGGRVGHIDPASPIPAPLVIPRSLEIRTNVALNHPVRAAILTTFFALPPGTQLSAVDLLRHPKMKARVVQDCSDAISTFSYALRRLGELGFVQPVRRVRGSNNSTYKVMFALTDEARACPELAGRNLLDEISAIVEKVDAGDPVAAFFDIADLLEAAGRV